MADATNVKERVPAMRLCDVLALFIGVDLRAHKFQKTMDALWGKWGVCEGCRTTIAPVAPVLWNGEGFVHAGHINNDDAVPWDEVSLSSCRGSVVEKLRQKKERSEASKAV